MAKNVINDFIEVITTLGFILIFILPFLWRKKKNKLDEEAESNKPEPAKQVKVRPTPQPRVKLPASHPAETEQKVLTKSHALFSGKQDLRRAIILKEILDKPKGLE